MPVPAWPGSGAIGPLLGVPIEKTMPPETGYESAEMMR